MDWFLYDHLNTICSYIGETPFLVVRDNSQGIVAKSRIQISNLKRIKRIEQLHSSLKSPVNLRFLMISVKRKYLLKFA